MPTTKRTIQGSAAAIGLVGAFVACNAITGLSDDYRDCGTGKCSGESPADASFDTFAETQASDASHDTKPEPDVEDAGNIADASDASDASDAQPCVADENDASADVQEGSVSLDYPDYPVEYDSGTSDAGRYVMLGDVAIDPLTNFSWQTQSVKGLTASEAIAHCAAVGGGWRLPKRMELITLQHMASDYSRCTDPIFDNPEYYFWSSTTSPDGAQTWAVHSKLCGAAALSPDAVWAVRCMHE